MTDPFHTIRIRRDVVAAVDELRKQTIGTSILGPLSSTRASRSAIIGRAIEVYAKELDLKLKTKMSPESLDEDSSAKP